LKEGKEKKGGKKKKKIVLLLFVKKGEKGKSVLEKRGGGNTQKKWHLKKGRILSSKGKRKSQKGFKGGKRVRAREGERIFSKRGETGGNLFQGRRGERNPSVGKNRGTRRRS